MKKVLVWTFVALLGLYTCGASFAQDSGVLTAITLDKLGLLYSHGTGARPLGMGGAFTAVSDDAFALLYNPAGLAQIRREEISLGFQHMRNEATSRYTLSRTENSFNNTAFGHISFVYPFPTYRLGAGLAIWDESIDFVDLIHYEDPGSLAVWRDDVSMDLDGLSVDFGLLFRISRYAKAGITITSPTWLSLSGNGVTDYYGIYKDGGGEWTTDPDYGVIDENYTLPMKFRAGAAFLLSFVTLTSDITYCDYTQTKRFGKSLIDEFSMSGKHTLEDVLSYHLGFEVNPESIPLRVRGGYAYIPMALGTTDEITIIEDDYPTSYIDDISIVKQRQAFSFGLGTLIDRSLALDATVVYTSYEFETTNSSEKMNTTGILISTAYRF